MMLGIVILESVILETIDWGPMSCCISHIQACHTIPAVFTKVSRMTEALAIAACSFLRAVVQAPEVLCMYVHTSKLIPMHIRTGVPIQGN